ncbi:MAG: hypothetical protein ACM37W_23400 [Actinomycetota bacterium]
MDLSPIPPNPEWQPPAFPLTLEPSKRRSKFKLSPIVIRLMAVGAVALPMVFAIGYWTFSSQPQKKVAPVTTFDPQTLVSQLDANFLQDQQQMNLFLWGDGANEPGQWQRLILAEGQKKTFNVDKQRQDKKHPCHRLSRDGCFDLVEVRIEKDWNRAAIQLDYPRMAAALFEYCAVLQARTGQVSTLADVKPNLMVAAMRKLRESRTLYGQQSAEAEAGKQIEQQREAEREFNREVNQP